MPHELFEALLRREQQALRCPHEAFATIASERDLYWSETWKSWIVTRYDDLQSILRDNRTFSSRSSNEPPAAAIPGFREISEEARSHGGELADFVRLLEEGRRQTLLTADAPTHGPLRDAMVSNLGPRAIKAMDLSIQATVQELLSRLPSEGEIDFVEDFAAPLPLRVVGDFLGIPVEQRDNFRRIADSANFGSLTPEVAKAVLRGDREVRAYFAYQIQQTEPESATFLGDMRRRCDNRWINIDEAAGLCREIVVAGNESTRYVLVSAMVTMLSTDNLQNTLRARPALIDGFIEEVLRLKPPFLGFWRRAVREVDIGNVTIKAGDALFLAYCAGNRDPNRFEKPDHVDIARQSRVSNFTFGLGAHFCVGMLLAKAQLKWAMGSFLDRFEHIELRSDPNSIPYLPDATMHAPTALRIALSTARPSSV